MSKYTRQIHTLRLRIHASNLSYPHIYNEVGLSAGWFMRMIRGDFIEPNMGWMKLINEYLDDYMELKTKWYVARKENGLSGDKS